MGIVEQVHLAVYVGGREVAGDRSARRSAGWSRPSRAGWLVVPAVAKIETFTSHTCVKPPNLS